ncbi:NAD-dependent epimerase/dehydratase family protein [Propioniciclava coleopterorum]|uniref:NAD-dependent epimerase/dehydratase family protein n=1 Tax=Propioniciclava coleopterorum TaxID=2714937 RepID=UPI0019803249|nr:NAD-dependent epimerase/dehydratase family protein [Propioniciclava coleopterorum]
MSDLFIVTGAGPVGTTVAELLRDRGARVRVLTRSGSGPEGTERHRVDARDAGAVAEQVAGADAVFHCAHAAYSAKVWARDLPAAERVVLDAAADAGAPVVFPESLYSYSRPDLVMDEDGPRDVAGANAASGRRCWPHAPCTGPRRRPWWPATSSAPGCCRPTAASACCRRSSAAARSR